MALGLDPPAFGVTAAAVRNVADHSAAVPIDGAIGYHGCSITPMQNVPWDTWILVLW